MLDYRIKTQLEPDVWTDISDDVIGDFGFTAKRGINGRGPADVLASPGLLRFTLDNSDQNSAGLEGYYAPGHANCRAGWDRGNPLQLLFVIDEVEFKRWTGTVRNVLPTPGEARMPLVSVVGGDVMASIADEQVQQVDPQIDKTEVELLNAAFDSLPTAAQPVARDFDDAEKSFTYAFHDLGGGQGALTVLQKILVSAQGFGYTLGDGTIRYRNRTQRQVTVNRFTFDGVTLQDLAVPSDLRNVFKRVRLITHPKDPSAAAIVLWSHPSVIALEPGQVEEFFGTYRSPDNDQQLIGGFDFEAVDPGVDFVGNSAEDGTGADLTADLDVTMDPFSTTVKVRLENIGASTVYVLKDTLQLRGKAIFDVSPVKREAFDDTVKGNSIDIDLTYRDDDGDVQADAEYLQGNYGRLSPEGLEFIATDDDDLELLASELEIGDIVTVNDEPTGLIDVAAFVQSIEWELDSNGLLLVRLDLAPRIADEVTIPEETYCNDRLSAVPISPETRVDYARCDFSEAA